MTIVEEPEVTQPSVELLSPVSLVFQLSDPGPYTIDWGDGIVVRGRGAIVRETHVYNNPGRFVVTTQIVGDSIASFQTVVDVLVQRDRQKTLIRWSGPVLMRGSLSSYVEASDDPRPPSFVQPSVGVKEGDRVLQLPAGLLLETGDSIQITEDGKRFSGGKIASILSSDQTSITLELDFQLTDSYSVAAQVKIVIRPAYGGSTVEAGTLLNFNRGTDDNLVHDSFGILLATSPGERVGRPELGFRGREMVFEPNDAIAGSMIQAYAIEAAASYERRIKILGSSVSKPNRNELKLQLNLQFSTGLEMVFDHTLSLNDTATTPK